MRQSSSAPKIEQLDAVVVGAGFAGLYMLHRFRQLGLRAQILTTTRHTATRFHQTSRQPI